MPDLAQRRCTVCLPPPRSPDTTAPMRSPSTPLGTPGVQNPPHVGGSDHKRKLGSVLWYFKNMEQWKTDAISEQSKCGEGSCCSQGGFAILYLQAQQLISAHGLD